MPRRPGPRAPGQSSCHLHARQPVGVTSGTKMNAHAYSDHMGRSMDEPIIAGGGAAEVVTRVAHAFTANGSRAIVNKEDELRLCLGTLVSEGTLLTDDAPGRRRT